MNKNSKKVGTCHICGQKKELTFEHIPPKAFFNNKTAKIIAGEEIIKIISRDDKMPWEMEDSKYNIQQKGFGGYTLCADCNNKTGKWYAQEYISFSKVGLDVINKLSPETNDIVRINIKKYICLFIYKFYW